MGAVWWHGSAFLNYCYVIITLHFLHVNKKIMFTYEVVFKSVYDNVWLCVLFVMFSIFFVVVRVVSTLAL